MSVVIDDQPKLVPARDDSADASSMSALVGRNAEVGAIVELLSQVGSQEAPLLLQGGPGIGKSALLRVASTAATQAGLTVLRAAGAPSETSLPFSGLHQLLRRALGMGQDPMSRRALLRDAIGGGDQQPADPLRTAIAALDLLAQASAETPLVLIVDDVQWLDRLTVTALGFIARRLDAEQITLIAAGRASEPATSLAGSGLRTLPLEPLDDAAARRLFARNGTELPRRVRDTLIKHAAGNPLALCELPVAWAGQEIVRDVPLPAWLPLSERLRQAFAVDLSPFAPATRALLLGAALNDGDSLSEAMGVASRLAACPMSLVDLEPLITSGILALVGTQLRFSHPVIRSAISQAATISERQLTHAALAEVLIGNPERRIWHRVASVTDLDEQIAEELDDLGSHARVSGASGAALMALERAAAVTGDSGQKARRLLRAAALASDLGHVEHAERLTGQAEASDRSDATRALCVAVSDDFSPAALVGSKQMRTLAEAAERLISEGETELASRLLLAAASRCQFATGDDLDRAYIGRLTDRLPWDQTDPRRLEILALTTPCCHARLIATELVKRTPDTSDSADDLLALAWAGLLVGAPGLGGEFFHAAIDALRREGRNGVLARALSLYAWSQVLLAHPTASELAAEEATVLATETGQPRFCALGNISQAAAAALTGDHDRADSLALGVEQFALPLRAEGLLALVQIVKSISALTLERHCEAFEHARRVFDPADPAYHPAHRWWALEHLASAALQSGRREEALTLVGDLQRRAAPPPGTRSDILLRHTNAVLADGADAEQHFLEALHSDLSEWPFDCARLQLAFGAWLRRKRRPADSRAPLRAAQQTFVALGLTTWRDRAIRELRASGEAGRRRVSESTETLTAQEVQIAELAANGLSNREIGERLYLSHRTVESHLYRAFPKLGITSRAQLSTVLPAAA